MAPNSQSRSGGGFFSGLFNRTVYKGNTTKKAPAPARTELSDQEMINILKAKGYKVLKQTWDEL